MTLQNFQLDIPENVLSSDSIDYKMLSFSGIESNFDGEMKGEGKFLFHRGRGSISYHFVNLFENPHISFQFSINDMDMASFVSSLNKDVYISGIMDIEGKGHIEGKSPFLEITFRSKGAKGMRQVMNFGAVKAISSIAGGSPVKSLGSSNFSYSRIAGKITIREGYLTLEGLAGESKGKQFLVKSGIFGGINLAIDKDTNTIKIEELVRTINKQFGSGL
ncbi:MAG TPA: hypothetical protein PKN36_01820 [bacterium]|nr:hypothetical protein [bacterium]